MVNKCFEDKKVNKNQEIRLSMLLLNPLEVSEFQTSRNVSAFDFHNPSTFKSISKDQQNTFDPFSGWILPEEDAKKTQSNSNKKSDDLNGQNIKQVSHYKTIIKQLQQQVQKQIQEKKMLQTSIHKLTQEIESMKKSKVIERQLITKQIEKRVEKEHTLLKHIYEQEIQKKDDIYQWKERQLSKLHELQCNYASNALKSYDSIINNHKVKQNQQKITYEPNNEREEYLKIKQMELTQKYDKFQKQKQHFHQKVREKEHNLARKEQILCQNLAEKEKHKMEEIKNLKENLEEKKQIYHQKLRTLTHRQQQVQAIKLELEQQKQLIEQFNNKMSNHHKKEMEELFLEKQRVAQLENALIEKINTIQRTEKDKNEERKDSKNLTIGERSKNKIISEDINLGVYLESLNRKRRNDL